MIEDSIRRACVVAVLFSAVVAAAVTAGCTGSAPAGNEGTSEDMYVDAYVAGMEHHALAQGYFNNGTAAWEGCEFRAAIADYANASMEYGDAASCYGVMARYANESQEREFADSLRGCAFNLSLAADDFMGAAIALLQNETDAAYDRFTQGQSRINASETLLNRSIELTPGWLLALSSP